MSEEEAVFDPSIKKKKKKKPFDLDAAMGIEVCPSSAKNGEISVDNSTMEKAVNDLSSKIEEVDISEVESFGKKKKKKKVVRIDEDLNQKLEPLDLEDSKATLPQDKFKDDLDLESFGEKKKKKKKRGIMTDGDDDAKASELDEIANPWDQSDRDYTYEELLQRVFAIMKEKNPELVAGEKKKFVMRPPQVVRAGTKKTAFVNFTDMANSLHRQPKHLLSFISAELGTVGAVDGSNQLILKGRFQQKHLESVMRRYIKEYVTCHTCKSPVTVLEKEDRLYFLKCMTCHSKCSVTIIKTGFQAVTSKRAAMRARE